jgi:hypothetical protein
MRTILASALSLLLLSAAPASKPARVADNIQHYWVYCIGTTTSVEMWDLEQMKVRRGSDVCLLHESTSMSGAQDWMEKNFPTHACSCRE